MQTAVRIGRAALLMAVAGVFPPQVGAQGDVATTGEARVQTATTALRWSGTGRRLGELARGKVVERLDLRSGWARVRVRGWMWAASLAETTDGYRVRPARENLRATPNGPIEGSLVQSVVVTRVGDSGRWYEVELIGWVEAVSLVNPGTDVLAVPLAETAASSSDTPAGRLMEDAGLRVRPGGETVTTLPAGTVVHPAETRGPWTRVVVEGWVPSAIVAGGDENALDPAVVAAAAPGAYTGRTVIWMVEHVALQEADEWRPDFEVGERYDLARVSGSDLYVYLVIGAELVATFESLPAFRTIRVEGTIRTGRSSLTRNPILDVTRLLP